MENRYVSKIRFSIKLERNLAHFSASDSASMLGSYPPQCLAVNSFTWNNYIAVNIVVTSTVFPNRYRLARNHFQFSSLRFIKLQVYRNVATRGQINFKHRKAKINFFQISFLIDEILPFYSRSICLYLRKYYYPAAKPRCKRVRAIDPSFAY